MTRKAERAPTLPDAPAGDDDFEKQSNKNIRQPAEETPDLDLKQRRRMALGAQRTMNADFYVNKYPDKKLMWINDVNGEVEKWIEIGAEPVPAVNKALKHFKGITDRKDGEWVKVNVGADGNGGGLFAYLLMMDAEEYDYIKVQPLVERQKEISLALGRGTSEEDGALPRGGKVTTYAAELPTGGEGFERSR